MLKIQIRYAPPIMMNKRPIPKTSGLFNGLATEGLTCAVVGRRV